jgi:hypothetical protein
VGFVVDKVVLGQVFSEFFGFPCQYHHSTVAVHTHVVVVIIIITCGNGGRSSEI